MFLECSTSKLAERASSTAILLRDRGRCGCCGGSCCGEGAPDPSKSAAVAALRFHRGRARYASMGQPPRRRSYRSPPIGVLVKREGT
jgi:hypothetical protein